MVDQKVNYNQPFDFAYKTSGKSKTKGQCKLEVIGIFIDPNTGIAGGRKVIAPKGKPLTNTSYGQGYFNCSRNEILQLTLTDKYNCELCEVQWTYHLFENNQHKFYRQCFTVLVTGILRADGKVRRLRKS